MDTGAEFSPCRTWRYSLTRVWDRMGRERILNVVGLNPSTADEAQDDPTIRRCIGFAKRHGFTCLVMTNLFAFRATDPKDMRSAGDPVGPENDRALLCNAALADMVVLAWGAHGAYLDRGERVACWLGRIGPVHCFGTTKAGQPKHPLYLPNTVEPMPYVGGRTHVHKVSTPSVYKANRDVSDG